MVTNLNNYGKQIRFMLSTDDSTEVEWHNGDLVFLMDLDRLYVFDADNSTFKEISMGGGGGGGGTTPVVLGSGDYTLASNDTVMTIPVSYTPGTVTSFVVYRETKAGTYAWSYISDTSAATNGVFIHATNLKFNNMAEWGANNYANQPSLADNVITVHAYSSAANIKADTYHWIIYGR